MYIFHSQGSERKARRRVIQAGPLVKRVKCSLANSTLVDYF